jgi:replicative DNA helicase
MTDIVSRPAGVTPAGTTPPQALEAERAVLAAMLLDAEAVGKAIEMIDAGEFYRSAHQKIFGAIVALYNRNERADLITTSEELRKNGELEMIGGREALVQIIEYASASQNIDEHMRIIHSKAILRMLIKASTEIQQECYAASDETSMILDRAESRVFEITDSRVRQGFVPLRDLLKPAFEHIQKLFERKVFVTGVPSGNDDLDKKTAGFQAGDLVIIAGRPSMGKTSYALNIAEAAAIRHQVPVAVFSLEMSKEQLVQRLLCSQSEVALHKLRSGYLAQEDWPRLTTAAGLLTQAPVVIDDSASLTVLEIRAKCRRLKAENRLGMVVIDYLQLIQPGGRAENRVQEISQITRSLKALAKDMNVPLIALSQLSRAVETSDKTGRPQLSDLRESGCLTADTRVLRADTGAEVTMGELLDSGERNIPVWTLNEDLKLEPGVMTHVFPSGVKRTFEMTLASGRVVKASANHPFLTLEGWKPLEQLAPGSRIAVPRRVPAATVTKEWPHAEVVMLAHLIGDGCFVARQPIHYTNADLANLDAVEKAAAHWKITPRRVAQKNWWHVYLPAPYHLTHGRSNPVAAWLRGLGLFGRRSHEKFIPREIFCLPRPQIELFLHHLWATDGCIHLGKSGPARIYYASSSRQLADDVQLLLARLGIQGRIRKSRKAGYRPVFQVHISGRDNQLRFLDQVGAHGARGERIPPIVQKLRSISVNTNVDTVPVEVWGRMREQMVAIGMTQREFSDAMRTAYGGTSMYKSAPGRERLTRAAGVLDDPGLAKLADSDVLWDRVVAIEALGEEMVYDATVPGAHNFIANGMVVHNSIEQDADLVMFVYREVVYNRETPEPNKAQIIIAKQRNGPTGEVDMTFLRECTKFVPYSPMMPGETESSF